MFTNTYKHNMDEKGRITVPASFREELAAKGAYVTRGFEQNLMVLPVASFETIASHLLDLSITDPQNRLLRRVILGGAERLEVDKAGRILISQQLRNYAVLENEVVFVGVGDHFEIWSANEYAIVNDQVENAQENAQRFIGTELTSH